MKIAILTLGCRTNQAESFDIEQSLRHSGHQVVDMSGEPDVCIINTCAVTSKADYQSRQLINRALRKKAKVIVAGCYSELNFERLNKLKEDIKIFRNIDKHNIIKQFNDVRSSNSFTHGNDSRHRPIIKVQDGCNFSCSYCTIPFARGRSQSVPADEIIAKIKGIELAGYNEVVLTGIHLGTYGLDFTVRQSLSGLLEQIILNTKIPRIRLSSLEIKEIDDRLLEVFGSDRVCKHLHIPLQSGDDNILKLMNRTYTIANFTTCIEKIVSKFPQVGLGTDVIVGFPGETDKEFLNTRKLIESVPFSYVHIFPYSVRPGTKAVLLPNHLPEAIKKRRVADLRALGMDKKRGFIEGNIGRTLDVIIESRVDNGYSGTTGNYIKALVGGDHNIKEGMLINIDIVGYKEGMAAGIPVNSMQPVNN